MALSGNAPVAFWRVNRSSAAAASTPSCPISAAAASKPCAMLYSRLDKPGNCFCLKVKLFASPLNPITFIFLAANAKGAGSTPASPVGEKPKRMGYGAKGTKRRFVAEELKSTVSPEGLTLGGKCVFSRDEPVRILGSFISPFIKDTCCRCCADNIFSCCDLFHADRY